MITTIAWDENGELKWASAVLDQGLSLDEIAQKVVPDGIAWREVSLDEALSATEGTRKAVQIRSDRDQLLIESDWTQIADAPVNQLVWATYRQALRDVPQQDGFPHNVSWPSKPE